ncbi:MAG TPA: AAA family ATPase [Candidatus Omnitrophota bacterium]|nr:AAA family ATPase [Candidatus Omnitrophota bacterium]
MFLKSLTLRGFKTFADRVDFQFESEGGITAVVGPNGCGKSNIVDAFRFALGESNLRELRVNTLPEVIFAGTSVRKPLSLAEVSISFDNTSKLLPIEYSEVLVKRRTFRDSTSEFSINQQPCRLKDIKTLFLDTGVSCESLSIIGQGRVDAILTSRPEERRAFFEEVAGVLKYKTRKQEVERKLIVCEQNLLRISDLKVEIGEQMISLESQAKKARSYQESQARLRELELGIFKKQVLNLVPRLDEVSGRIAELKKKEQELSDRSRQVYEEKLRLREDARQLDDQIESSRLAIESTRESIKNEQNSVLIEHERQVFSEKNRLRDLNEEERFIRFEMERMNDSLKGLQAKKEQIKKQISEWSAADPAEFLELAPVIEISLKAMAQLNRLTADLCGKEGIPLRSHEDDKVFEMFRTEERKILDDELSISDSLKAKNSGLEQLTTKREALKRSIEQLEGARPESDGEALSRLRTQLEERERAMAQLREEKNRIGKALDELETQPSQGMAGTSELMKEEIALARLQAELSQIADRVQADYGMTEADLMARPAVAENVGRSRKEAEELKDNLRMLEPVNLLAIDEYEKIKERHAFIETQFGDLSVARENLKTLISELDLKAGQDFQRTLETITKNFKEIFSSLFEGGEAEIEVVGNDSIEISVCPSGRKLLSLSLLSGGERSLAGIALLLSFLKTQPSPLCILDEVDAALDEANVTRFSRFIKGFAGKTQIIVITHNKRTMEAADVIYGITMEEPGVSKMVSMKLEKVGS